MLQKTGGRGGPIKLTGGDSNKPKYLINSFNGVQYDGKKRKLLYIFEQEKG